MATEQEQELYLSNREELEFTGVTDVINYDEQEINLETNLGSLVITGEGLHIQHLDLEEFKLVVTGKVNELKYDQESKTHSFFQRLFK